MNVYDLSSFIMNLGRKTTWFENLSISSMGVLVGDSDFDENSDPFQEQPQAARLLYSFLEIAPILGLDQ